MSNQITSQLTNQDFIFNSIKIRVQGTYEEPLFCLADVCKVLNLTNASKVAEQIKTEFEVPNLKLGTFNTGFGIKEFTMITEPQLYFVMMRSRSSVAKSFRQWICNEVIPKIRKTGKYEQKPKLTMRQGYVPASKDLWSSCTTNENKFLEQMKSYHNHNILKNSLKLDVGLAFSQRASDNYKKSMSIVDNTPLTCEIKLKATNFLAMTQEEKLIIMRENNMRSYYSNDIKCYKFKKCPFPYIDLLSISRFFGLDLKILKTVFFKNIDDFILGQDLVIIDTGNIDDENYLLSFTGIDRIFNYYFS